jgi:FkbM family methyltransferase
MREDIKKEYIFELINKDKPLILDIGTYDGKDSMQLKKLMPEAEIICFEADERSASLFTKQTEGLTLIRKVVSNKDGHIEFYPSESNIRRHYPDQDFWSASSSIKKPFYHLSLFDDVYFKTPIIVESTKLDTWHNGQTIDFIWCDINGGEKEFIEGAINTLTNYTRYLYIEFSNKELYEGQITKDEILKMLPSFTNNGVYNYHGNFGNILLKNDKL